MLRLHTKQVLSSYASLWVMLGPAARSSALRTKKLLCLLSPEEIGEICRSTLLLLSVAKINWEIKHPSPCCMVWLCAYKVLAYSGNGCQHSTMQTKVQAMLAEVRISSSHCAFYWLPRGLAGPPRCPCHTMRVNVEFALLHSCYNGYHWLLLSHGHVNRTLMPVSDQYGLPCNNLCSCCSFL